MGFIGKDRSNEDAPNWCITAPTAEQEPQQDVVTTHDIYYENGIACCTGDSKGD
jgi:hypothetical protein